jgi:PAS domain S-box-containing protein
MIFGFRSKVYFGLISLLLLLGIVIFLVVNRIMNEALLEENHKRGSALGINLAARSIEPMLAMDFLRMKNLVDETVQLSSDIFYTFILNDQNEILVHTFKGGFPIELKTANSATDNQAFHIRLLDTGEHLVDDVAVPVMLGQNRFGTARLGLLRTKVQQTISRLKLSAFIATGGVILIAAFVGTTLVRPVTRRIKILHQSSEQALKGNLDVHTAPMLKKNCWEIMQCHRTECPAYGNLHHRCWYLAGTKCPHCVEGEYAKKITSCHTCPVYRKCSGDEIQSLAESFDSMTLTIKNHLSEIKSAEKFLEKQQKLLKTILDASPEYVYLQDPHSVYLAANKAFCQLLEKQEQEIIGKTDFDLFDTDSARQHIAENQRIIKTGRPMEKQEEVVTAGGKQWFHVVKIPVRDPEGKITGVLRSARDITELKEIQARLIQSQKMESIGQLAAGIAHEINTPLGIILGYAQVLAEEVPEGGEIYEDLKTIERQSKVCRKIVADLLRFSRHTETTISSLNINQSITDVVSVMQHPFKLERIEIITHLEQALPLIRGDKEKIEQVFVNLLNNAHDAIGSDGTIHLTTKFDAGRDEIVIQVLDTGSGISSECLDKIFDPFFTTKAVGQGTGLGLAVTFGIIQEHGGRIEVESPPRSAEAPLSDTPWRTLFSIYLPAMETAVLDTAAPSASNAI